MKFRPAENTTASQLLNIQRLFYFKDNCLNTAFLCLFSLNF